MPLLIFSCRVSFTDGADVTNTVSVSASSLYKAAVLGIVESKGNGFAFANIGTATRLKISAEPPATTHELSVGKLQAWLDRSGKTPASRRRRSHYGKSSGTRRDQGLGTPDSPALNSMRWCAADLVRAARKAVYSGDARSESPAD